MRERGARGALMAKLVAGLDFLASFPAKYEELYDLRSQGCDQGQDPEVRGVGRVDGSGSEKGREPSL
jgi:hypothetical protein